jgi:hypothetical protein
MGSTLRDRASGDMLWIDTKAIVRLGLDEWCRRMTYPSDLEPAGVVDDIVFMPPFVKMEQYGRFFDALEAMNFRVRGSESALNVYRFAYDWRQDNRISARLLGQAIEHWRSLHPGTQVWIIAHSNGGVVSRWYIEKEGGKSVVQRLILMGSPYDGTPKVMRIAFNGADMFLRPGLDPLNIAARTRTLFRTFPSLYQLMPLKSRFLRDSEDRVIDPFTGAGWLDDPTQREYLRDGQRFTAELGDAASVETLCFFGRKKRTLTSGRVRSDATGPWSGIDWKESDAGDGTIPERSAAHPKATSTYPFVVGHGDIYVDPAVLEFLRWELIDKFAPGERAFVATPSMAVTFVTDKDAYQENETVWLRATVEDRDDAPIADATLAVTMRWAAPLPGDSPPGRAPDDVTVNLVPLPKSPGTYEGLLYGPATDGFYRVIAQVEHPDAGTATVEELVAVETTKA